MEDLQTKSLHAFIGRFREGDVAALNTLIARTGVRLERLTRKMLKGFPGVGDKEQTGDVLNGALMRLARALREADPASVREYYALGTEQIRRELLDLARRHKRRPAGRLGEADPADAASPDLDTWAALHEAVEGLPAEPREVFCLTFYHDWTQAEIAALLQTHEKRVRQLWRDAIRRLDAAVGSNLPPV
jgi:RNA polymerase sigma factor (sigma-70 family)